MIPRHPFLLAVACAAASCVPAFAETAPAAPAESPKAESASSKLDVGSPAPALSPAKWLQGEPVTAFEKDKLYLIECWATWCGPCVAAIPHVNALHNKFKDKGLVVIGVNVWEEPESKAAEFVKKKGEGMAYRVAYDGGNAGLVARNWLAAAGANGIPHAFVVRENKIYWHGHPSELTETVMADMLAGKFDPAKAAEAAKEKAELITKFGTLHTKFQSLCGEKKLKEAEAVLDEQVAIAGKVAPEQAPFIRHGGLIELALASGDKKAAAGRIRDFALAGRADDAHIGSQWAAAMQIVTEPRLAGERDYAFALECLECLVAKESQAAESPFVGLVRARLQEAAGKTPDAVKTLEGVVAGKGRVPPEASAALAALKAGKPWPKDRVNPDAKDESPAVPASEKKE